MFDLEQTAMPSTEIKQVLANWIEQATKPPGPLAKDIDPTQWVAEKFLHWWRQEAISSLEDAERAAASIRAELERQGGWANDQLELAMEEMTHLDDSLSDLRARSGLTED
jgi:hypothetical protein